MMKIWTSDWWNSLSSCSSFLSSPNTSERDRGRVLIFSAKGINRLVITKTTFFFCFQLLLGFGLICYPLTELLSNVRTGQISRDWWNQERTLASGGKQTNKQKESQIYENFFLLQKATDLVSKSSTTWHHSFKGKWAGINTLKIFNIRLLPYLWFLFSCSTSVEVKHSKMNHH